MILGKISKKGRKSQVKEHLIFTIYNMVPDLVNTAQMKKKNAV